MGEAVAQTSARPALREGKKPPWLRETGLRGWTALKQEQIRCHQKGFYARLAGRYRYETRSEKQAFAGRAEGERAALAGISSAAAVRMGPV